MRFDEHPTNTEEQIREYLAFGLLMVTELNPPDDLRIALFTKAVEFRAGKQMIPIQSGAAVAIPTLGRM